MNKFEYKNLNVDYLIKKHSIKIHFLNNEKKNLGYLFNFLIYKLNELDSNKIIMRLRDNLITFLTKISIKLNKKSILESIDNLWVLKRPQYIFADYINTIIPPFSYISQRCANEKIKLINLPHGINIFIEQAANELRVNYLKNMIKKSEEMKCYYDYIITPNVNDFEHLLSVGYPKKKIFILGSMRYSNNWIRCLTEEFSIKTLDYLNINKRKIIVIFLNKLLYGGNSSNIKKIIEISMNYGFVIIKPHTRKMKINFIKDILKNKNIFLASKIDSNTLINNLDIAVFWGSSIALQAIMQKKKVIYAKFAHNKKTIYDEYLKNFTAEDLNDYHRILKELIASNDPMENSILKNIEKKYIKGGSSESPEKKYLDFFDTKIQ